MKTAQEGTTNQGTTNQGTTNQDSTRKKNYRPKYKGNNRKPANDQAPTNGETIERVATENGTRDQGEFKKSAPRKNYKKNNYSPKTPATKVDGLTDEAKGIDENILFGRNSVMEILKSGRTIEKILVQKGNIEGSLKKILGEAKAKGIVIQEVEKQKLDELCAMEKHQGVLAYVAAKDYCTVDEILNDAKAKGEDPFVLILDNIQDPHNLGAIIRSAHNAGVHGIIIPKRRAVGLTSTVSKSSAGAIEYMKVAKVPNIGQTIEYLKEKGIWVACADMDGQIIYKDNLRGPIGIVIGSEGEGISHNVKNKCDFVVSIPMYGKVTSLNASVAASILVYEVVRQRHF